MADPRPAHLRFGPFVCDVRTGELSKAGRPIKLQEQPRQLLVALLRQPGEVLSRDQLRQHLWPAGTFVDFDNALNVGIRRIREALGDTAPTARYVETVRGLGYRFIAPVVPDRAAEAEPVAQVVMTVPSPGTSRPSTSLHGRPWLWVTAAVGAAALLTVAVVRYDRAQSADASVITRIAVLPFENLTANRDNDWLASAFSESLTSGLQGIDNVISISRDRIVEIYQHERIREGAPVDAALLRRLSNQLGVRYYVHGSYQLVGDEIKVVARLVDQEQGTNRAQETASGPFADLLRIEDDLAARLAAHFASAARTLPGTPETTSLDAYRTVVEARIAYADAATLRHGLALLQRAIELDPRYAQAWALRSKTRARLAAPGAFDGESIQRLRELRDSALADARRALELDPSLYDAHIALALAHREMEQAGPWRTAAEHAAALNPRGAEAQALLGDWYGATPSFGCARGYDDARAESHYQAALRLDPRFGMALSNLIHHLVWADRTDRALRVADEAIRLLPDSAGVERARNMALVFAGRIDDAEPRVAAVRQLTIYDRWLLATIALRRGNMADASREFAKIEAAVPDGSYGFRVALSYLFANQLEQGLPHLERALSKSPDCVRFVTSNPHFAPYRDAAARSSR